MATNSKVFPLKMVIFHRYVKLPEGTTHGHADDLGMAAQVSPTVAYHPTPGMPDVRDEICQDQ